MRSLHLVLLLCLLAAPGCAVGHNGVIWEAEDSTPAARPVELPLPVRLGVRLNSSGASGLHVVLVEQLRRSSNFEVVRQTAIAEQEGRLDYVVELDYEVEAGAKLMNFVTCFPGFVVLAPWWGKLRWDYDVTTRIRLLRPRSAAVAELERFDAFELAYTDAGYSIGCNLGFLGLVFLPATASPLVVGCITAVYDGQALGYRGRVNRSHAMAAWGQRIGHAIAAEVERDLATRSQLAEPAPEGS